MVDGKEKGGEPFVIEEVEEEGEGRSFTPHSLPTKISRGETPLLNLSVGGDQVSTPPRSLPFSEMTSSPFSYRGYSSRWPCE